MTRRLRSLSLTTKLVASVVTLFVALTAVTGTATVLVMRHALTQQVDDQLAEQLRVVAGDGRGPGGYESSCERERGPGRGEQSLLACLDGSTATGSLVEGGEELALSSEQLSSLDAAGVAGRPRTVDLPGIGSYRLVAARAPSGATVVTGLPMEQADASVATLLTVLSATSLFGLTGTALLGGWVVRRNLRPLRRVAGTATEVSRLRLDEGEVALATRVAPEDADPRTEVGQVGLALNSMLDNVEGALDARQRSESRVRQFVADASHELRTPLASIRGYAELSRRERDPVPATVQHHLGRVESEAIRMQGLVEDLLLLARLDAGRPLEREPVDLTLLAMTAVGDITAAAPGHRWRLDLPDEPVEVTGDEGRLRQVLVNLLANARTHTPPGTTVTTSLRDRTDGAVLAVTDDGPGVPEGLQGEVFERFTRGDDARNRAGGSTGLGLSIVESVVEAHGGRVTLDSRPGRTTFAVYIPS